MKYLMLIVLGFNLGLFAASWLPACGVSPLAVAPPLAIAMVATFIMWGRR